MSQKSQVTIGPNVDIHATTEFEEFAFLGILTTRLKSPRRYFSTNRYARAPSFAKAPYSY